MVNPSDSGVLSHRLFVSDRITKLKFLVDSGSDVSLLPRSFKGSRFPARYCLSAANGTSIKTYGSKLLVIDVGLKRKFVFTCIIADVSKPILGADFLQKFGLLVDIRNKQLIDPLNSRKIKGQVLPVLMPSVKTVVGSSNQYHELLKEFPEITKVQSQPLKVKHDTVHHIQTFGPPVCSRARRLHPAKLKAAKDEFTFMLEHGICRPSKSPWASPLHMVPKNNSDWRPTVDYRSLNCITRPDKYPLPNLQDFTQNLAGSKIFSKIDLVRAFNQIPVFEPDIEKTAVITPFGLFEFVYMPYGLCNSPQTFQRFIHEVLFGLDFCFAYLDDVLVASKSEDEHLQHLRTVFERFSKFGLTLNVNKCVFGEPEVSFLGHLVDAVGCKPLPDKVDVILNYPKPQSIKDLQRFLGCVNFYRRFIPYAADLHAPLNDLLRGRKKNDNSTINWTPSLDECFQKCKHAIVNVTHLAHPEPDCKLALFTDASDFAVAGALHKVTPEGYVPLSFFSKKLNNAQCKYSVFDKELLAIYLSIIHFRFMLEGHDFYVATDHKPLTFALAQGSEKCSPRRLRHLEFISQFTNDIRYVQGSQNFVADALSRIESIELPVKIDFSNLVEQQQTDVELQELLDDPSKSSLKLKLINLPDFLKPIYCDISCTAVRIFIPKNLRRNVFESVHNLAHVGTRATIRQITAKYIWPSVRKDLTEWCRTCLPCQKSKVHKHTISPLGTIPVPNERFQHIHLDLIGPLPLAQNFKFCLTVIDRYTRWVEVVPLTDATAENVCRALIFNWISRFGAPARISCDQGGQFGSFAFIKLLKSFGIEKVRTAAYNPKANGFVERLHRTLKASLMCYQNSAWLDALPLVLLGLRTAIREEWNHTPAELVYGQSLRLPGELFTKSQQDISQPEFIRKLQNAFSEIRPVASKWHSSRAIYVPKDLYTCTHVFIRIDAVRKSLQPPYEGPFRVLGRRPKVYLVERQGSRKWISLDRLKPAFLPVDGNRQEDIRSSTTSSNVPPSAPPPYVTRSGRTVRFRQ